MKLSHYDVIVVGAGGVGSAAAWRMARRGARVLAIDRFTPPHDRGSSHGQTRILRQAYFEHPDYVPLTSLARAGWRELESLGGPALYQECGLLQIGPAGGKVLRGVVAAARQHELAIKQLDGAEIERRWPSLAVPEAMSGLYEQQAGYLLVEDCVKAQIDAARNAGAEFLFDATVLEWNGKRGDAIVVRTTTGDYQAERLVVTTGAWAGDLLSPLGVELRLLRKMIYWYACDDAKMTPAAGFPAVLFELPTGIFYGFPKLDERGVKVAEHSGGLPIAGPSQMNCDDAAAATERRPVEQFIRACLPSVSQRCTDRTACMYTMSPDEHFIVDRWPGDDRIVLAAGLSGHGFKFAPVLGEALADLALQGKSKLPIDFLSLARLAK